MDDLPQTRHSLLARISDAGDDAAWREFVGIYEPVVLRLLRSRGLQAADADDVCQEVFRAVTRAIDRWEADSPGAFRAWLFQIARNLMVNFLVWRQRHPQAAGHPDIDALLLASPAPADEDSRLVDLETKRQLFVVAAESIRREFSASTWQAFWFTAVENRPVKEAAIAAGVSVGAVYIARSRVLARLRERVIEIEGREGGQL